MMAWPLLSPIMCLLGGYNDPESANLFLYNENQYFAYTFFLIVLLKLKNLNRVTFSIKTTLSLIVIFILYFLFHSLVTNFSFQQVYLNIKELIYILLPLTVMIIDKRTIPDTKPMYVLICIIMTIEVIFVYLNQLGIHAYAAWYLSVLEFPEFANLATGTFYGSSRFPDYCATIFTLLTIDYFSRRRIPPIHYIILSIICLICLFAAGSRMPLALSVIIFFITVFTYGKQYKSLILCLSVVGYFIFAFLGSYNGGKLSENEGVNRIVKGLTGFTQSKKNKEEDQSTVRISSKLIDSYFWSSPIIGNGRESMGDNAYTIDDHISDLTNLKADALLAFKLVEYGVLGILLWFFYFKSIFKYLSKFDQDKKKILLLFIFFVILSITENGLWDRNLFPYVFIYFMSINKDKLLRNNKIIQAHKINEHPDKTGINSTIPLSATLKQ